MSEKFAIAEVMPGKLNALIKNIMKQMSIDDPNEAVRRVNSGEWIISEVVRQWRKGENGVIYFSVIGEGLTGLQCLEMAKQERITLSRWARDILTSPDYYPAEKGKTYEIAVFPGSLFSSDDRITKNIRSEGRRRGWKQGRDFSPELVYLIRKKFTDKEIEKMGIRWIIGMHEPIEDSGGGTLLLGASRRDGGPWLGAGNGDPGSRWPRDLGFAFVSAQVGIEDCESQG